MKELKVGERVTITLEVVKAKGCSGCFFNNDGFSFFYNNQKLAIIHYIHELQHIFYGLKINSEMEV